MVNQREWQVELFEGNGDSYIFIVPGDTKQEAERTTLDLFFAMSEFRDIRIEKTVTKMFFNLSCHMRNANPEYDLEE